MIPPPNLRKDILIYIWTVTCCYKQTARQFQLSLEWFWLMHIQSSSTDSSFLQGLSQSFLIHQTPTCTVHQERTLPHLQQRSNIPLMNTVENPQKVTNTKTLIIQKQPLDGSGALSSTWQVVVFVGLCVDVQHLHTCLMVKSLIKWWLCSFRLQCRDTQSLWYSRSWRVYTLWTPSERSKPSCRYGS